MKEKEIMEARIPKQQQITKRSQRDYSMSFKLAVVAEVEVGEISVSGAMEKYGIQGHATVLNWIKKFGTFDREMVVKKMNQKTPQQQIFELEQKVRLLERQNAFLEQEVTNASDKAHILDRLVDIAEREYKISIRKNSSPEQSQTTHRSQKKR